MWFAICFELQTTMAVDMTEGSFAEEIAPIWLNHFPLGFMQFLCGELYIGDSASSLMVTDPASQKREKGGGLKWFCVRLPHSEHGFVVLAEVRTC